VPSTDITLREESFTLVAFGRVKKVQVTAFVVVAGAGRRSLALKRIFEAD
jgi:hypothetical protein